MSDFFARVHRTLTHIATPSFPWVGQVQSAFPSHVGVAASHTTPSRSTGRRPMWSCCLGFLLREYWSKSYYCLIRPGPSIWSVSPPSASPPPYSHTHPFTLRVPESGTLKRGIFSNRFSFNNNYFKPRLSGFCQLNNSLLKSTFKCLEREECSIHQQSSLFVAAASYCRSWNFMP